MEVILVLLALAVVVLFGFLFFAGAGPRRVVRRRVVDAPPRVRRRVVREEVEDVE